MDRIWIKEMYRLIDKINRFDYRVRRSKFTIYLRPETIRFTRYIWLRLANSAIVVVQGFFVLMGVAAESASWGLRDERGVKKHWVLA